jgi:hypothetical protein
MADLSVEVREEEGPEVNTLRDRDLVFSALTRSGFASSGRNHFPLMVENQGSI